MRTNLPPIIVPPPPVTPPGRPLIEEFHKGIFKPERLADGTHVWKAKTFVENAKTELKFLPLARSFLESRNWIKKINKSFEGAFKIENNSKIKDPIKWDYAQWAYGRYASLWGQSLIANGNLCLKVRGLEQLEEGAIYLFAPTHNSFIETPLLYTALEAWSPGFLADQRFKKYPYLGRAMITSERHVFVDRKDPQSAARALMKAVRLLRKDGNRFSFVVFPQGTRARGQKDRDGNRIDGYLIPHGQELLDGVAEIFIQTADYGVKLVPMIINRSGCVLPPGTSQVQTGEEVEIILDRPSPLSDFGGRPRHKREKEEMRKNIMSTIVNSYRSHYSAFHIDPSL